LDSRRKNFYVRTVGLYMISQILFLILWFLGRSVILLCDEYPVHYDTATQKTIRVYTHTRTPTI